MLSTLFHAIIYDPLYNTLVFLIEILPSADVGIAVITLTILVKLILFPLARRAFHTQEAMKKISPELDSLKKKHKDDKQAFAKEAMDLYRTHGVHPLASFLVILIQLPIIIGLYWVFLKGGLPQIDQSSLYSFVPQPDRVNMVFLGIVSLEAKSIILAVLAALTQFAHAQIAIQPPQPSKEQSFQNDLSRTIYLQMRYVFPFVVGIFAYTLSAAIALYFIAGNVFSIGQDLFIRRAARSAAVKHGGTHA
jgi:YidC/Oxa1 family membrane protein insertase